MEKTSTIKSLSFLMVAGILTAPPVLSSPQQRDDDTLRNSNTDQKAPWNFQGIKPASPSPSEVKRVKEAMEQLGAMYANLGSAMGNLELKPPVPMEIPDGVDMPPPLDSTAGKLVVQPEWSEDPYYNDWLYYHSYRD